ncbi:hypothetical protein FBU59_006635 [Linderina macrospora]|uniref:Uncharacterized protein n=1 Tax=Linderina macrospora TaxID=4868 RepID=A0ACC1IZB7_9FUNG|nr:hypothetical protein FBU59_006635 [Linderina macrospora]
MFKPKPLTVTKVFTSFKEIALTSGANVSSSNSTAPLPNPAAPGAIDKQLCAFPCRQCRRSRV